MSSATVEHTSYEMPPREGFTVAFAAGDAARGHSHFFTMAGLDPASQYASVSERMTRSDIALIENRLPRGRAALGGRVSGRPW
jgi:hypothetical protein